MSAALLPQDSTQQTMLTTWLVELFLNDLGALKDEGNLGGHAKMTQEFHIFLESKSLRVGHVTHIKSCDSHMVYFPMQECLEANSKTVYDLLSSHGAVEDMVFFAMLMKGGEHTQCQVVLVAFLQCICLQAYIENCACS